MQKELKPPPPHYNLHVTRFTSSIVSNIISVMTDMPWVSLSIMTVGAPTLSSNYH